jgi:ribosomal protein L1
MLQKLLQRVKAGKIDFKVDKTGMYTGIGKVSLS